jgi:predicted phosphodiesterase
MRILAVSDIHNNVACVRKLRSQEGNDFDVIAIAGDIGGPRASEIFEVLKTFACPIVYAYGNWDYELTHTVRFGKRCHLIHLNIVKVGSLFFTGFSEFRRGRDPIIKRIPKTLTGSRYVQKYRDALVEGINASKIDLKRTVVITHERVTKMGPRLPNLLLYLYGHIHRFDVSNSKGSTYVNVSALDRILPVLPTNGHTPHREQSEEERRWEPYVGNLRHVNAGNYAVIEVGRGGTVHVECRILHHAYDGWRAVPGPQWFGAPLVPQEAECGFRCKADRIPTQAGQRSDDCGQPMRAG